MRTEKEAYYFGFVIYTCTYIYTFTYKKKMYVKGT